MKHLFIFMTVLFFFNGVFSVSAEEEGTIVTPQQSEPANAKNWISGEFIFITPAVGARYERMFNSYISAGLNVYLSSVFLIERVIFRGLESFLRVYPWGNVFFISTALGYFVETSGIGMSGGRRVSRQLSITPEIGWKISICNIGFFLQPGIGLRLLLPRELRLIPNVYLGIGYAF